MLCPKTSTEKLYLKCILYVSNKYVPNKYVPNKYVPNKYVPNKYVPNKLLKQITRVNIPRFNANLLYIVKFSISVFLLWLQVFLFVCFAVYVYCSSAVAENRCTTHQVLADSKK